MGSRTNWPRAQFVVVAITAALTFTFVAFATISVSGRVIERAKAVQKEQANMRRDMVNAMKAQHLLGSAHTLGVMAAGMDDPDIEWVRAVERLQRDAEQLAQEAAHP